MEKLKIKTHKFIENAGRLYLFISETSSLFEIDNHIKDMINPTEKTFTYDNTLDEDQHIMSCLNRAGFFVDTFKEPKFEDKISQIKPSALVLMLSQDCNLRCNYCYAGDGEYCNRGLMRENIAKMSIDYAFENFSSENISIILFGGEPLLNHRLFEFCVKYSKQKAKETNKEVNFSTTTNATLLNDKNSKILRDNRFNVTISIDGDADTHNKNRFYANKKGTYDDIVNNINKYLGFKNVAARATLTKFNPNIKAIYDHLFGLGFKSIHIAPSIEYMNKNSYDKLIKSYIELVDEFKRKLKFKEYDYCFRMSNIMAFLDRAHTGGIRRKYCGAYNNMLTVDIDGSFHGCHRFVATPKLGYGNILSNPIMDDDMRKDMMRNLIQNQDSPCQDCWISGLCGGGCPAENMMSNKDVKRPHDLTCYYLREVMSKIIETYIELDDEEKKLLFENRK